MKHALSCTTFSLGFRLKPERGAIGEWTKEKAKEMPKVEGKLGRQDDDADEDDEDEDDSG